MKISFSKGEKELKYNKMELKVKNILSLEFGHLNYSIGEFPDGSIKGFVLNQNEVQNMWNVNFNERQAYERYFLS